MGAHVLLLTAILFILHNQMLYPRVDLDKVDDTFWCGLELTKAAILALDIPGMDHGSMQNWTLPARIINLNRCARALADGAWATSYSRYYDWYEQQRKAHNSSPSIQTTHTCAPHQVCIHYFLCDRLTVFAVFSEKVIGIVLWRPNINFSLPVHIIPLSHDHHLT